MVSTPPSSYLTPTQRYAAGALMGLALHQAQLHQTRPLGLSTDEFPSPSSSSTGAVSEDPNLWVHHTSGLLRPIFIFLDIDSGAWSGLEETSGSSLATRHVGPFLRLLSEEYDDDNAKRLDQELALSEAVDALVISLEKNSESSRSKREKSREYEHQCREKFSTADVQPNSEKVDMHLESQPEEDNLFFECEGDPHPGSPNSKTDEGPDEELMKLSYQRKVTVLYELLAACLSDLGEKDTKYTRRRKGYDARHRVALRLLATWLDIKWTKMEAVEMIVSSSAMAIVKEQESNKEETQSKESGWAKWKRSGIIGAAALTGGTLMAITGGINEYLRNMFSVFSFESSGFAAAASAAGTVAGSVAVAASFGAAGAGLSGTKMARRVGSVDEFEFKTIGDNHNQGRLAVEILVSGFVFAEEDFVRPWEGQNDNLERYALQWESKNLLAVSTAIQDWLTSRIATELMRQGAMLTVLSGLLTALAWPATLLSATDFIDSIWTIAIDRSDKAGKLLAEVLLGGLQGNRPVTLIGYSLGARVIFKCLECLAETENRAELVERVVLLGAPIAIKDENWEAARKVVAGRFINAYSRTDWMLGVAFRASLLTQGLAGIQPIDIPGIQNVDVTDHIEGHSSYLWATQRVLDELELETYYPVYNSILPKE
ncbi:unnamed protein product [Trifolium pratense]|uniref:Uncharacterized protein n=1 Tax=Trifolium pratense TaxID=57577 RepID=A0ACB0JRE3_TRIPR|nr:unnamed protein product [Trifolium pratense]